MNVVYAATGQIFFEEAITSSESLLELHLNARIIIYTDIERNASPGIEVRVLDGCSFGFRDKIVALNAVEFDHFLFLDSDTYVTKDLSPTYALLDRFEFMACLGEVRIAPKMAKYNFADFDYSDIPVSFPEYNSGVMFFRKTSNTTKMLRRWLEIYDGESAHWSTKVPDQPSLRRSLYEVLPAINCLPQEFNVRLPYFGYYESSLYILHGRRTKAGFKRINLNKGKAGPRIYVPRLGFFYQESKLILASLRIRGYFRSLIKRQGSK